MSENDAKNVTCLRIPGDLDSPARLKIDSILNEAAGGDYIAQIRGERLVAPSTGFTLNEGCHLDLCLAFQLSLKARVALNTRGVEFLPTASAQTMNPLRWN